MRPGVAGVAWPGPATVAEAWHDAQRFDTAGDEWRASERTGQARHGRRRQTGPAEVSTVGRGAGWSGTARQATRGSVWPGEVRNGRGRHGRRGLAARGRDSPRGDARGPAWYGMTRPATLATVRHGPATGGRLAPARRGMAWQAWRGWRGMVRPGGERRGKGAAGVVSHGMDGPGGGWRREQWPAMAGVA